MAESVRMLYDTGYRRCICPDCGGGETRERSFSIWVDNDTSEIVGRCYRAGCGYIEKEHLGPGAVLQEAATFTPKPLRYPYRLKEFGLFGERVLIADPTVTVWQLYDINGRRTGHVTRTPDKRITMFKEVPEPVYYSNGLRPHNVLWLFEDPRSAAVCRLPAVALLGTNLPGSLLEHLSNFVNGAVPRRSLNVFVALDPGAEEAGERVHKRLRDAGLEAVFVPMLCDFKDMDEQTRELLLETYQR